MDTIGNVARALATSGGGLQTKHDNSSLQLALDDRMILSEAIAAATSIIERYPNGGANAGKGYIGALAATLIGYPRSIATACADLKGVTAESKFLPTVADVAAWCERSTEPLRQRRERERRVRKQLAERERESDRTPESIERVRAMNENFQENHGARKSPAKDPASIAAGKAAHAQRIAQVEQEWQGGPPTIGGVPVSRELARMLDRGEQPLSEAAE